MSVPNSPNVSIVRLKRKRNAPALDALVIDDLSYAQNLAKRTRLHGPGASSSNALTSASSSAKPVFRLLDTVSLESFDNEVQTKALRDRVTSLLKHPAVSAARPSNLAKAAVKSVASRESPSEKRSEQYKAQSKQARFKVIQEKRSLSSSLASLNDSSPVKRDPVRDKQIPEILSAKKDASSMKIVDIEQDISDYEGSSVTPIKSKQGRRRSRAGPLGAAKELQKRESGKIGPGHRTLAEEEDDVMRNFVPMLQEYLSLNDVKVDNPIITTTAKRAEERETASDEDDYVYDVYYRSVPAPDAPLVADELHLSRIGQLSGLSPADLFGDPAAADLLGSDDSDDDPTRDEEEQDSNEEDFYKNDYPEQDAEASEDELEAIDQAWVGGEYLDEGEGDQKKVKSKPAGLVIGRRLDYSSSEEGSERDSADSDDSDY